MSRTVTATHIIVALLFAALGSRPTPAVAQENPFLGTWSTSQKTLSGDPITAYFDFYANGAVHIGGVAPKTGSVTHLCGSYQFNQATVQFTFSSYTPRVCGLAACDPIGIPLNTPIQRGYQFPNPNLLIFSDDARYVRESANPFPLPPTGCQ
jgi:hypothetical protein